MKTVSKNKLVNIIYDRLDGTIPKLVIYDVIDIILDDFILRISNNESLSIANFGTFSSYVHSGHKGVDVSSGQEQYVKDFKYVKFIPHDSFTKFIEQRKNNFKKKG